MTISPPRRPPTLPGVFDDEQPRRHKPVRQTARAQYHLRRDRDIADAEHGRETATGAVARTWRVREVGTPEEPR